jgi:site-specific recombinase XerD
VKEMEFQEAFESFKSYMINEKETSQKTIDQYEEDFLNFLSVVNKNYNEVTKQDIGEFIKIGRSKNNVGTTINKRLSPIRQFYRFCNEYDIYKNSLYNQKNVSDKGQTQRLNSRAFLSPDRFEEFIDKNEEYFMDHPCFTKSRKWVVMYILMFTGAREFEVCDIKENDVTFIPSENAYQIVIQHGKGDKRRIVYIPDSFRQPYESYLSFKKKMELDCEYLICTSKNKKLHEKYFNKDVEWLTKNAGIDLKLSPHRLRDCYADYVTMKGVDVVSLSSSLGHKHVETTIKKYLHNHDDLSKNIVSCFKRA